MYGVGESYTYILCMHDGGNVNSDIICPPCIQQSMQPFVILFSILSQCD